MHGKVIIVLYLHMVNIYYTKIRYYDTYIAMILY